MEYYQRKIEANCMIDDLYSQGVIFDTIVYKVSTKFGFGENFVIKRINLIDRVVKSK